MQIVMNRPTIDNEQPTMLVYPIKISEGRILELYNNQNYKIYIYLWEDAGKRKE